jgi:hypothetical protein
MREQLALGNDFLSVRHCERIGSVSENPIKLDWN